MSKPPDGPESPGPRLRFGAGKPSCAATDIEDPPFGEPYRLLRALDHWR